MSEAPQLTYGEIDRTVLDTLRPPTGAYWLVIMVLIMGVLLGAACWIYQIFVGIGAGGHNIPVAWGTYLIISSSGEGLLIPGLSSLPFSIS